MVAVIPVINAQSTNNIVINPNGSHTGTTSILQNGNIYTFTANITSNITVQRSNIVIDGAGFAITGGVDLTNGVGGNPSNPTIQNVTIKNLIMNGTVGTNGGGYCTFYNDYIMGGIYLLGSAYNNITYCTVNSVTMDYGSNFNFITENNLNGALAFLSSNETVDKNYWSDYLTKYPNATEIDSTGIGNQPYVYSIVETRIPLIYQDNHPLMKPVIIPLESSSEQDRALAFIENVLPIDSAQWRIELEVDGNATNTQVRQRLDGNNISVSNGDNVLIYFLGSMVGTADSLEVILVTGENNFYQGVVNIDDAPSYNSFGRKLEVANITNFLTNYQSWSGADSAKMIETLSNVDIAQNTTTSSGNLTMAINRTDTSTAISWVFQDSRTFSVSFKNDFPVSFYDERQIPSTMPTATPSVPEIPSCTIPLLLGFMVAFAGLLVYCRKGKQLFSQENWTKK